MKTRVASAGTGKTTALVLAALTRIGTGTPLRRIAAVTFTRMAAGQLRGRLASAVRDVAHTGSFSDDLYRAPGAARVHFEQAERELDGLLATTIHGFMADALRLVAPAVGLRSDFEVLDEGAARALFDESLASLLYLARDDRHPLNSHARRLGARATILPVQLFGKRSMSLEWVADSDAQAQSLVALYEAAYRAYLERLGADRLGPGEVERRAVRALDSAPVSERIVGRRAVVLVDEFQDVNPVQGSFFERLEAAGADLEVVGDPKQSIYGFRNADVEVFRRALGRGERLDPLTRTYRHAPVIARFLNGLTSTLAQRGWGFTEDEAPEVTPAAFEPGSAEPLDPPGALDGRLEIHWVHGDGPIHALRRVEARILATRLGDLHRRRGYAYGEMAVVARSRAGLGQVATALEEAAIPYVVRQGRGFYERQEIRDLFHALRAGLDPAGASLAAWLRSPFAGVAPEDVEEVMAAPDPSRALDDRHPEIGERLRRIRGWAAGDPLEALVALVRAPFLGGRRYLDFLDRTARENVDALLFELSTQPPRDVALMLDRLTVLARRAEAGDVPPAGDGVQLVTVHGSKGLEWKVVAVYDLGRMGGERREPLELDSDRGLVCLPSSPGFAAARAAAIERSAQEEHRLLYVAASRPREVLLFTGSVKQGPGLGPEGWARALSAMGLGAGSRAYDRPEFLLQTHAPTSTATAATPRRAHASVPDAAPWIDQGFPPHPLPPLQSPSSFDDGESAERAAGAGVAEDGASAMAGERSPRIDGLPSRRGAAIGTLVHYAIARDWNPDDARHRENLRAQEVMFPFSEAQADELLAEVAALLRTYRSLLGTALPSLAKRAVDRAEVPFAFRRDGTVWQGVIDRLYRVGDRWWLDDYKTDRVLQPDCYHLQAAVYRHAARQILNEAPSVRLVSLREGRVIPLGDRVLETAFGRISAE